MKILPHATTQMNPADIMLSEKKNSHKRTNTNNVRFNFSEEQSSQIVRNRKYNGSYQQLGFKGQGNAGQRVQECSYKMENVLEYST